MRISCSRCEAQYDLPDEKLARGAAKIRCTKCGHVFVVKRKAAEEAPPEPARPPEPPPEPSFDDFFRSDAGKAEPDAAPPPAGDAGPSFEDYGLRHGETPEPAAEPPEPSPSENRFDEFDFSSASEQAGLAAPAEGVDRTLDDYGLGPQRTGQASEAFRASPGEASLDDFEFSGKPEPVEPAARPPKKEASFDDFEFDAFSEPGGREKSVGGRAQSNEKEPAGFLAEGDELPSLGELDLGEFDDSGSLNFEGPPRGEGARAGLAEPAETVRREDLVSAIPRTREVPLQALSEDIPRLDLQKGPRRAEAEGKPSPLLASDRRRSPLSWVVAVAVLATAGYTGYNVYLHPEALTFLNPQRVRELWRSRDVEANFATEDVKGYGQDLPGGRRVFVIRGRVVNKSGSPQGLIRVRGNLYGRDGAKLASSEVYCGNLLSDRELASLPRATIEARLQNQVGEALSNVDIAPGGGVPFLLVFPAPPGKVENFNVLVSAWRGGGS